MQRFERNNLPSKRGKKLRYEGSNPTGTQTQSFKTGPYTDDVDYETGCTHLNQNIRATNDNHQEGIPTSERCRRKEGCLFKEPLS